MREERLVKQNEALVRLARSEKLAGGQWMEILAPPGRWRPNAPACGSTMPSIPGLAVPICSNSVHNDTPPAPS